MLYHTDTADLTYHNSTPTRTRTYADPRAAARGKQRQRKCRQKYHDFKLIPEADVARAASTHFLTPELDLARGTERIAYNARGTNSFAYNPFLGGLGCVDSCVAAELDPQMVLKGKRAVWKRVDYLSAPSKVKLARRSVIGKNTGHGLFNDTLGEQQRWDVELGELDGLNEMREILEASVPFPEPSVWQEYDPELWDDSSVPIPEENDVVIHEDWHFVDNWLAVVSDGEQESASEDWDLLSDDPNTGWLTMASE